MGRSAVKCSLPSMVWLAHYELPVARATDTRPTHDQARQNSGIDGVGALQITLPIVAFLVLSSFWREKGSCIFKSPIPGLYFSKKTWSWEGMGWWGNGGDLEGGNMGAGMIASYCIHTWISQKERKSNLLSILSLVSIIFLGFFGKWRWSWERNSADASLQKCKPFFFDWARGSVKHLYCIEGKLTLVIGSSSLRQWARVLLHPEPPFHREWSGTHSDRERHLQESNGDVGRQGDFIIYSSLRMGKRRRSE